MTVENPNREQQKRNRLQLMLILGIVLIPVIGSTFMFYTGIGMPKDTKNNGDLIEPPLDLENLSLRDSTGSPWSWRESGKFRFVVLLNGNCDLDCERLLHTLHQVHVRLAKRGSSVERVLIQLDDAVDLTQFSSGAGNLPEAYVGLIQLHGDLYAWRRLMENNPLL